MEAEALVFLIFQQVEIVQELEYQIGLLISEKHSLVEQIKHLQRYGRVGGGVVTCAVVQPPVVLRELGEHRRTCID